eukprot:c16843_g1_i2.p1 GENE.c16843_g1_i2~~c16843_g1_i2.p1  ORF type:complete len:314 (+),score=56.87 c16843_g1_i2:1359-2300(+)
MLIAHAHAVQLFRTSDCSQNGGVIGITLNAEWHEPMNDTPEDAAAADKANAFNLHWFADPVYKGDYPQIMKDVVGDRLPRFTDDEKKLLKGSSDFFGLNHYVTMLVTVDTRHVMSQIRFLRRLQPSLVDFLKLVGRGIWGAVTRRQSYFRDSGVIATVREDWEVTDMGWPVVPWGLRKLLHHIHHRYAPMGGIVITENGLACNDSLEHSEYEGFVNDKRVRFFRAYLHEVKQAIREGVDVRGYYAWSLLDNFEWSFGYSKRFGLYHVDYTTQIRTPRPVACWYASVIQNNYVDSENLGDAVSGEMTHRGEESG